MEQETSCAHAGCECEIGKNAVQEDGRSFCSRGCADGEGCTHSGCNCAAYETSL